MNDRSVMNHIVTYIEDHLNEDLTLDTLAKEFNYSEFYISRLFSENAGCTIYKYIRGPASDIQIMSDYMQKSKQRLNRILAENTGRTIEEIARDTERDHYMTAEKALSYGMIDGKPGCFVIFPPFLHIY